jgi:hypothetical protein
MDFDGGPDFYVVDFGPGRVFCCRPDEVRVDDGAPLPDHRRHKSKS